VPDIGATLREARMRARIDVSEIEAQTKIRAKYLRALENEEWDLLPGPTFVKSFLRTYAQALGLDAKGLVEEYRLAYENPNEGVLEPIAASPRRAPRRSMARPQGGPSRGYVLALGAVCAVIVLLVVLLVTGGGGSSSPTTAATTRSSASSSAGTHRHTGRTQSGTASTTTSQQVTLSLQPAAPVYVCLIGEGGRRLIPGLTLQPGAAQPTYHARRFVMTLGNSSVTLLIDGTPRTVPPSSEPIGYSITKAGRHTLEPGQLPTCK